MRLPKEWEKRVHFANWCRREQLDPRDVAELRVLTNRHASAYAQMDSTNTDVLKKRYEMLGRKIDEKAVAMGITEMDWPGLFPTFTTPAGNRNVMLPDD